MEATMNSTISQQGISTLDVLWAFYLSQPKQVRKAFRVRLELEDKQNTRKATQVAQWQKDLKSIRSLKAGWDEEGAPRINRDAIAHANQFLASLNSANAVGIRLFPTHLGAVMLKLETQKGRIKCEFGDSQMSWFVKREGLATEHHSFEDINSDSWAMLASNIESIV